ncbi:hypothetical protein K491DRAFT_685478 [Lophiostoma macrostomum CBS 122681]|uniref:Uncharacterized protein n=1 Tax=Lophiostoma macrostomum CBS 122681 TaxID=1314788 RepID=A0A6A6SJB7_9PLEO|nr:hypothetical protein K491DRAFT_685478 [Lophiostoma macrostomum CBS 122681]
MSNVIRRYKISPAREAYCLVKFCFTVHSIRPASIPIANLVQLIAISRNIDTEKFTDLLVDIFCQCTLGSYKLPKDKPMSKDLVVLEYILYTLLSCQLQVVQVLSEFATDDGLSHDEMLWIRETRGWVLKKNPNLQEIIERLGTFFYNDTPRRAALFDSSRTFAEKAINDVTYIAGKDKLGNKIREKLKLDIHLSPPGKEAYTETTFPRLDSIATTIIGSLAMDDVFNPLDAYSNYDKTLDNLANFNLDNNNGYENVSYSDIGDFRDFSNNGYS